MFPHTESDAEGKGRERAREHYPHPGSLSEEDTELSPQLTADDTQCERDCIFIISKHCLGFLCCHHLTSPLLSKTVTKIGKQKDFI